MCAQTTLTPLVKSNLEFLEELENTMMLLAYEDLRDSPAASLLDAEHRKQTDGKLKAAFLSAQQREQRPQLPMMLRMMQCGRRSSCKRGKRKTKKVPFPKIHHLLEVLVSVICRPTKSTNTVKERRQRLINPNLFI